jgi:hypothetical protein
VSEHIKLRTGQYLSQQELEDLRAEAAEAWDDAGAERGPWKVEWDVADISKLCNELVDRRAAEGGAGVSELRRRLEALRGTQALLERVGVSSGDAVIYEHAMVWLREEIGGVDTAISRLERP